MYKYISTLILFECFSCYHLLTLRACGPRGQQARRCRRADRRTKGTGGRALCQGICVQCSDGGSERQRFVVVGIGGARAANRVGDDDQTGRADRCGERQWQCTGGGGCDWGGSGSRQGRGAGFVMRTLSA